MARSAESVNAVIKAYDVRGVVGDQIDARFTQDVGASFARLMRAEGAKRVVIGHDMRESSPELANAFAAGVTAQGLDVTHIGLASTDELYFASGRFGCPGAMFTASHNPARYNGIKLCRANALPVGQDTGLATIKDELVAGIPDHDGEPGSTDTVELLDDYAEFLRALVRLSADRPLTIAVDAGNGMGGHTVPAVLGALEHVKIVPLFFELDGTFPNHEANPLDPKNLVDLQHLVRESGADIGLAFDGDADRCFVVDENGEPVSPSAITALVAERELAKEPGATIIHNLITSSAVAEIVQEHGGKPVRSRVGHSFIKAEMARTNAAFGGEHSAHYYFRDFWFADTGMLAAMHLLAALGEQDGPLSELARDYQRYAASGEINSTVPDQRAKLAEVRSAYPDAETDEMDGLTMRFPDGAWINLRPSNTEPLLRLNVEAPTPERMATLRDDVLGLVRR